jgi:hypothetical protein
MGHKQLVTDDQIKSYPDFLKKAGQKPIWAGSDMPIIVRMDSSGAAKELEQLIQSKPIVDVVDNYGEQYAELLLSRNAHLYRANYDVQVASIKDLLQEHYGDRQGWEMGSWVYFPWNRQLVHILAQTEFEELRTIRNRDLITADEQAKLQDYNVAVAGMSVGSASALGMAIVGISRSIKLADGAAISGSNLNRILTGVSSVGKEKAHVIGHMIYEMNPYSTVHYHGKIGKTNIADLFDRPWPIDLIVDEIDDIEMKVRLRIEARKRRLPVVMATEIGDTVMLDVERFDIDANRQLFHGLAGDIERLAEQPPENHREWMKNAVKIIGPDNMPLRMQKSLLKIGTTIVTHPQLGSTVMMTGGIIAFAAKRLALGHSLKTGRYIISLEKEILELPNTRWYKKRHKRHTKVIKRSAESM